MTVLELKKRVSCAAFLPTRTKANDYLLKHESEENPLEIMLIYKGVAFAGYAIMTPEQMEYYNNFFVPSDTEGSYFDGVFAFESTDGG